MNHSAKHSGADADDPWEDLAEQLFGSTPGKEHTAAPGTAPASGPEVNPLEVILNEEAPPQRKSRSRRKTLADLLADEPEGENPEASTSAAGASDSPGESAEVEDSRPAAAEEPLTLPTPKAATATSPQDSYWDALANWNWDSGDAAAAGKAAPAPKKPVRPEIPRRDRSAKGRARDRGDERTEKGASSGSPAANSAGPDRGGRTPEQRRERPGRTRRTETTDATAAASGHNEFPEVTSAPSEPAVEARLPARDDQGPPIWDFDADETSTPEIRREEPQRVVEPVKPASVDFESEEGDDDDAAMRRRRRRRRTGKGEGDETPAPVTPRSFGDRPVRSFADIPGSDWDDDNVAPLDETPRIPERPAARDSGEEFPPRRRGESPERSGYRSESDRGSRGERRDRGSRDSGRRDASSSRPEYGLDDASPREGAPRQPTGYGNDRSSGNRPPRGRSGERPAAREPVFEDDQYGGSTDLAPRRSDIGRGESGRSDTGRGARPERPSRDSRGDSRSARPPRLDRDGERDRHEAGDRRERGPRGEFDGDSRYPRSDRAPRTDVSDEGESDFEDDEFDAGGQGGRGNRRGRKRFSSRPEDWSDADFESVEDRVGFDNEDGSDAGEEEDNPELFVDFDEVPTWEEAISYLLKVDGPDRSRGSAPRRGGPGSGPPGRRRRP